MSNGAGGEDNETGVEDRLQVQEGTYHQAVSICRFCGAHAPLNKEHLFPDWLRQALPAATKSKYFRRKGDGTIDSWRSFSHNTTTRIACYSCNGGWMSAIEGAAAPLLLPKIVSGTPDTLTGQQLAAVVNWFYLKALVIQSTTVPAVAPDNYYHDLFATHAPRPGTLVWLGALTGIDAATGFFVGAKIDAMHNGVTASGYMATIGVGAFAARLVYVPPSLGQLGPVTNAPFDANLVKIWPGVPNAPWPPQKMDFAAFATFNKTLPNILVA